MSHAAEELCGAAKFHCGDGQCIKDVLRCDGFYDCNNFADEQNCGKKDERGMREGIGKSQSQREREELGEVYRDRRSH